MSYSYLHFAYTHALLGTFAYTHVGAYSLLLLYKLLRVERIARSRSVGVNLAVSHRSLAKFAQTGSAPTAPHVHVQKSEKTNDGSRGVARISGKGVPV